MWARPRIKFYVELINIIVLSRTSVDTPVSRHINSHSFEGFYPVRIYILTLIREDADSIEAAENRNKWENYWMARLYSYVPKGLNIKD